MSGARLMPDSPIAVGYSLALGLKQGKWSKRKRDVRGIVIHTTGRGPIARFEREGARKGDATPFDTAVRIYSSIYDAGPHYVVGQEPGEVTQLCPEHVAAWHVGFGLGQASARVYGWRNWHKLPSCAWWRERWTHLDSPLDLVGADLWTDWSANHGTIGIEVVPPIGPGAAWSQSTWASVLALALDISKRHGIPFEREYVISHSDAHPLARSSKGFPYDPPSALWTWDRMRALCVRDSN